MAARNLVTPKILSESTDHRPTSTLTIDDQSKRHIVIGIALVNVLLPELKNYVDKKLSVFYNILVQEHQINTTSNTFFQDKGQKLHYKDPRNPQSCIIHDHHQLAQLYILPSSLRFKSINDDTFDASAVLTIMTRCSRFSKKEKEVARWIRDNVRNDWAHFNNTNLWTHGKFTECFKHMIDFAKVLPKPYSQVAVKLQEWKTEGVM